MTREEFIKLHGDRFLAKLHRAFMMRGNSPELEMRWIEAQVNEIDNWLGSLHEALLTELKNAQVEKQPLPKPDPKATGGAASSAATPRRAT